MAITVGDAVVYFRGDDSHVNRTMKKTEQRTRTWAGRIGTYISRALATATGNLLAGAISKIGRALAGIGPKLIEMGSHAEEMMGKFTVVFGEFSDEVIRGLDDMAREMGRSRYEMREFAANFQDTFVPLGFARGEAARLSQQLVALTYDVASFNNTLEPDTARDFQSALVGNHETVRKYGIVITQTALEQELLNMGLEGGMKAATEQQKVMARLNMLMSGTADAQGDAVRTAGSWANQMRALKSAFADLSAEIGLKLLPVFTPLLSQVREFVQIRGPEFVESMSTLILGPIAAAAEAAMQMFNWIADAAKALADMRAGMGEYAEAVAAPDTSEQARLSFQIELLREMVIANRDLGGAYKSLSEDQREAIRQNTMMYESMQGLSSIDQEVAMQKAELAYQTAEQAEEVERLLNLLPAEQREIFNMKVAEEDLRLAMIEGNRIRDIAAQRWQGLGESMSGAVKIAQDAALSYATPVGMHFPETPEQRASREVDAFINKGKKIAEQRKQHEADAKAASEEYWSNYETLAKESWGKIQGYISGAFKSTQDWIRIALEGTSADLGDAWDEMARRAEAVIGDVEKTGTSPWLNMFDIPEDILKAGGDQLKAFMTQLAADIRQSPTVQELGTVGIDAMVKNIKEAMTNELGLAGLEQTIALQLATDPEAVALMEKLGIDVSAAMNVNKDGVVASIEGLKTTTLSMNAVNIPDLLPKNEERSLLSDIVSAVNDLAGKSFDVDIGNWKEMASLWVSMLLSARGYAEGGVIPGPPDAPQLAVVHGGETIVPAGQSTVYNFSQTVNTQAEQSTVIQDFNILRSMAGVA